MKKGGIFRLVVPDLEWAAKEYLAGVAAGNSEANTIFIDNTSLGVKKRAKNLLQFFYQFLATSTHLWMWDAPSLQAALAQHGFINIRRCYFGDCEDAMFKLVEDAGRFENAVAMEARC
jgi:predicted SAM-dependent methyltransferase